MNTHSFSKRSFKSTVINKDSFYSLIKKQIKEIEEVEVEEKKKVKSKKK